MIARTVALAVGCALACRHAPPTITGAQIYAQLAALHADGRADVGGIQLRRDQYLIADATSQVFPVTTAITGCTGDAIDADTDCPLALVPDLAFRVSDTEPTATSHEPTEPSWLWKARFGLLGAGVGLTAGVVACGFPGCKAVFGVPLFFDAFALLISFTGMK